MDTVLTSASTQLLTRPSDEHHSFLSFRSAALRDHQCGREVPINARALLFTEEPVALAGVALDVGIGRPVPMTHYALSQACSLAGTSPAFLGRVQPPTRARILNEALNRADVTDRVALLHQGVDSPVVPSELTVIRSMTSKSYRRLWDAEILEQIDRWLLPMGWIPAVPTFPTFRTENYRGPKDASGNPLPALFRGDRDSFQFYYSPKPSNDGLGGLRRGIVVYNSEVGARSFGFDDFLFRDVCGNFMIWGAEQVTRKRARHVGRVHTLFGDFRSMLQRYSIELDSDTVRRMQSAAVAMFAETTPKAPVATNAAERLVRQFGVGKGQAMEIAEAAMLPVNQGSGEGWRPESEKLVQLDYFAIANGASWLAHTEGNADAKMALAQLAGEVLAGAGA